MVLTKKEADEEARRIFAESNREAERIIQKAKEDGIWKGGLDGDRGLFKELNDRTWIRIQELAKKIDS